MTTVEVLRAAKALPWCKGRYARNAAGYGVSVMDRSAARFCVDGAICHASGGFWWTPSYIAAARAMLATIPDENPRDISIYNDLPETTQADRDAWFDRAIAAEEAKESVKP